MSRREHEPSRDQEHRRKSSEGDDDDDVSVSSEESEDEDLVLEGVLVRDPNVSSSDEDGEDDRKPVAKKRSSNEMSGNGQEKQSAKSPKKQKKKSNVEPQVEILQVEFTFCDMHERFFHGLKNLLHSSSTLYQGEHSSNLSNLMIQNVAVGTTVSTADDTEDNVFAFASVLNVTMYQKESSIQYLKQLCLDNCPSERKAELEVVLSGTTKRPAGFLLHGRMINVPLEIVHVLHDQLCQDMDWAVKNASGGLDQRKALDFGIFLRLAPCQKEAGGLIYRYFDDEILESHAEFSFAIDAPKSYSKEEKEYVNAMVLTKEGYRKGLAALKRMVQGTGM